METKAREWIIYEGHTREAREFISGSDIAYAENIKVIEYSAYEKLEGENKKLREALEMQPCDCYQIESDHEICQRCEALGEVENG